ncbi:hypothetical protein PMPD1_2454 [Paramixta manurensis]|uniref:Uncharacterized protein n=1 Tax=Paramixta manurensis TaxID=2740817 RepID=A0A6M8U9H1_9GAMM|nr:hypothetical protein PMPD1_2454 [Erwiniaceae bacterium PD-1]
MKNINDALNNFFAESKTVKAEEISEAVENGNAVIFGSDDVRIVLKPMMAEGIPYVLVWLAVSSGENGLAKYIPEVQKLTRLVGGRWFEFYTQRRGFIRVAEKLGFKRMPDEDGFMKFRMMM